MRGRPSTSKAGFVAWLVATLIAAFVGDSPAEDSWGVPGAVLRARVEVTRHPTHADAGVIVTVPDGGILPHPHATPTIVTAGGRSLRHAGLWHNPAHGLSLVMEDTSEETWIYLQSSDQPYPLPPLDQNTFKPSLLFYYVQGDASLDRARLLGSRSPVGTNILFAHANEIYDTDPPAGRNGDGSSLYTGWFPTARDGAAYFYSISKEGSVFYVDGDKIHAWSGITGQRGGATGDHGGWRATRAGLHRIDYFHFNLDPRAIDHLDPGGREAHVGMRRPDPAIDADNPPLNVPRDARSLRAADYVRSGSGRITELESREGPVAAFDPRWIAYITAGTNILCHYRFEPMAAGTHPAGTTYTWEFDGGVRIHQRQVDWVFHGRADQHVKLHVLFDGHASTTTRIFFPKRLPGTRLSTTSREGRAKARAPVQRMLAAANRDSAAQAGSLLSPAFMRSMISILDVGQDRQLLESATTALENGSASRASWEAHRLQELFEETLRVVGSTDAMPQLPASTTDSSRDGAARLDQVLRDGDLAFLNHHHDEAHSHYESAAVLANAIYHDGVAWAGRRLKEAALVEQIDHDLRSTLTSETYLGLRDWERQFPHSKIEGTWWRRYAAYAAATERADLARLILTDLMEYAPGTKGVQALLDDLERGAP